MKLKRSEMRIIDDALWMNGGYVLDFSNRTFDEFFEDKVGFLNSFLRQCGWRIIDLQRQTWSHKEKTT